ncbi:MAG: UDP-N-acetylmuramoyl-L-alanine--D-glutamate ligase, partial [Opitutales bacterium]
MKGNRERIKYALRCPIAVFGDGVSGRAAARLARSFGAQVEIFEENGALFGPREAEWAKVVVSSPGFSKDHPWLALARKSGCAVVGELDFASVAWPGEIIAVTGSNGKTTVTEFLTKVLREAGNEAVATGNVGHPLSAAALENASSSTIAVCEVSSFQAESLEFLRPSSVLWTSFSEDHLDRHADLHEYFEAKANLARRTTTDRLFLGTGVSEAARSLGRHYLKGFEWQSQTSPRNQRVPLDSPFSLAPQRGNYSLVRAFCRERGLSDELIRGVAREFHLPGHRFFQPIQVGEVSFWNDSKATNFGAAVAACRHFAEKAFWIGGGQSKGGNLEAFCHRIKDVVRRAYLIGSSASEMLPHFARAGTPARSFSSLGDAVKAAFREAGRGADIVFSPGFASFDQFINYEDRGKC